MRISSDVYLHSMTRKHVRYTWKMPHRSYVHAHTEASHLLKFAYAYHGLGPAAVEARERLLRFGLVVQDFQELGSRASGFCARS